MSSRSDWQLTLRSKQEKPEMLIDSKQDWQTLQGAENLQAGIVIPSAGQDILEGHQATVGVCPPWSHGNRHAARGSIER